MNFDIKNFNNQRKNLKNINNKKNIYSKTDIFIAVIEIFVMVPFILFNLPKMSKKASPNRAGRSHQ